MILEEIRDLLHARVLMENLDLSREIQMVMASDLMSDVLSFCESGALLLTGLTNLQVVRTADVLDICAIIFVRGKIPSEETIRIAQACDIPLFATDLSMYEACGLLYSRGVAKIKNRS